MKFVKHKSLFLIDFEDLFFDVKFGVEVFCFQNEITLKKDIFTVFSYDFLTKVLNFYESISSSGCIPIFIITEEFLDKLLTVDIKKNLVNYPKFMKAFRDKMQFNCFVRGGTFTEISNEIIEDDFLYDEILERSVFLSTIMPRICKFIRNMKFHKLDRELAQQIQEQIKLCCY